MRRPYLHFFLDLGFLDIRTALMYEAVERGTTEYIVLSWRFFRWGSEFRLYDTWLRRNNRAKAQKEE